MRFLDDPAGAGAPAQGAKVPVTMAQETPARPRRTLLVVNGKSRSGQSACDAAEEALVQSGIAVDRRDCGKAEDLLHLILRARHEVDSVVVGGGDGTLNAALPGILETGLPMG
ncbi:MAG TPA: diacylglycerol kinase family protein, partial [Alphaproteobacteria bacterium]|nr:diacylglycerol kinase family protein [Alphaproteobacteria bacterium]